MANPNWASLSLRRGGDVVRALGVANATLGYWRSHLNDMWNVVAVSGGLGYGAEGMPMANSHYGYHLVAWHLLFAISGQLYDAPRRSLAFEPRLDAPFALPVLVPSTAARLACDGAGGITLTVVAGKPLRIDSLRVGDSTPPDGLLPARLAPGQSVSWVRRSAVLLA
jgi:non-lysosomal glucosylceramidase